MARKILPVAPVAKPRMVHSDRWKKRPVVRRYFSFCNQLRAEAGPWQPPASGMKIIFFVPMAKSWSKKKKRRMESQPHTQRPDLDNFIKAFLDALCDDDAHIWSLAAEKRWTQTGKGCIVIDYQQPAKTPQM